MTKLSVSRTNYEKEIERDKVDVIKGVQGSSKDDG